MIVRSSIWSDCEAPADCHICLWCYEWFFSFFVVVVKRDEASMGPQSMLSRCSFLESIQVSGVVCRLCVDEIWLGNVKDE